PIHGIPEVIAIQICQIRRGFEIRMIRTQIPFVRVQSRGTAVPAEEDLTARLTVQQLQHAGAARARERRYVMERAAGTWSVSRRRRITRRVRADPEALKIAKKQ